MTRPRTASERFVEMLSNKTRSVTIPVYSPLLDIRKTAGHVDLAGIKGLIFTSSNGVNIAANAIKDRDLPCFCVGNMTTMVAQRAGWTAIQIGQTAEELIANLLRLRPQSPLLHLRGEHSRGDVSNTLTQSGLHVAEKVIYEQNLLPFTDEAISAMASSDPVVVPLFSPRAARQFAKLHVGEAPLWLAALSDAVAKPLETVVFEKVKVAKQPDADAMKKAVEKLVKRAARVEGARTAH